MRRREKTPVRTFLPFPSSIYNCFLLPCHLTSSSPPPPLSPNPTAMDASKTLVNTGLYLLLAVC